MCVFVFAEEYSDHPNEVVKNEELTYNGASSWSPAGYRDAMMRPQRLAWALTLLAAGLLPHLLR